MGCNVPAIAPGRVVMTDGNPIALILTAWTKAR
jgi:hypothetical protein